MSRIARDNNFQIPVRRNHGNLPGVRGADFGVDDGLHRRTSHRRLGIGKESLTPVAIGICFSLTPRLIKKIKDQFDSARDAQLVKDSEEVVFDGMLA